MMLPLHLQIKLARKNKPEKCKQNIKPCGSTTKFHRKKTEILHPEFAQGENNITFVFIREKSFF